MVFFEGQVPATGVTATLELPAGVVGVWSFEEEEGDVAHDSTPYHNDGTLSGGPVWTAGYRGGGLAFDGLDDHVAIPSSASLDLLTDTLTLEAWVYPNPNIAGGKRVLISRWGDGNTNNGHSFQLALDEGRLHAFLSPDGVEVVDIGLSQGIVPPGIWSHVAFVKHGQRAWYYINGVCEPAPVAPPATIYTGKSSLYLGIGAATSSGTVDAFDGTLDEVKVYRGSRTDYAPLAQGDWQGGPGQATWNGGDPTRYAEATYGIDDTTIGQLRLKETVVEDTVIYSANGTLTSSVFDAGRPVTWTELSWTSWVAGDAALNVAVAFGDDEEAWTDWITLSGEHAIGLNRQALPLPVLARLARYRVTLQASSDGTQTPVLYNLTLHTGEKALYVDANAGTDGPGCGLYPGADACRTIRYTLDERSASGLTIRVAPGIYVHLDSTEVDSQVDCDDLWENVGGDYYRVDPGPTTSTSIRISLAMTIIIYNLGLLV